MLPDGTVDGDEPDFFYLILLLLFSVNYVQLGRYLFIFIFPLVFSGSIGVKMGKNVAL